MMKVKIKNPIYGVPLTFLDKYCPEQFEIVWQAVGWAKASSSKQMLKEIGYKKKNDKGGNPLINNKHKYARILIKHK